MATVEYLHYITKDEANFSRGTLLRRAKTLASSISLSFLARAILKGGESK
ncbi:hypothetical protein MTAT_20240 [Moorella thermoacetica]|uniref:Uncharacterized protein n=1 Tax=Neomoorella thermoacetica TaxID=1525 RepID=A0AAC9HIR3_NEOTH|nr:hypothetical protein [Moorella thermoacetica]AOQ24679.1 hypothetical protein Maut_02251 [Moorella thermoacetica]TYL12782.1 hypothetical protein MTAT_20240 [Moorella thermoacetica]